MQICGNTSITHKGCNKNLLVKYLSNKYSAEYPELELDEFQFKVTDKKRGISTILSFDDLIGHESGCSSRNAQGIFIESNEREGAKMKPIGLEGQIFIHNSKYYYNGINPTLDIEYVGLPRGKFFDPWQRPEERIVEILAGLEQIWREFPDLRFGQLMYSLAPENRLFGMEDDELLTKIRKYYLKR